MWKPALFHGSRVIDVLELLAVGLSQEEVLEELPDLEPEDIEAALRFASRKIDYPVRWHDHLD